MIELEELSESIICEASTSITIPGLLWQPMKFNAMFICKCVSQHHFLFVNFYFFGKICKKISEKNNKTSKIIQTHFLSLKLFICNKMVLELVTCSSYYNVVKFCYFLVVNQWH